MNFTSVAERTRNAVLRSKKRVWTVDDFKTNKSAALRELCRLTEEGYLIRASKGIYVRPVMTLLGPSTLSMEELAKIKARRKGANVVPTGYAGFNILGLTTQVSSITELAVDKPMRITNSRVRFVVRDRKSLARPLERSVLEALRRINHV
jgi:predicted transcriptional regulator of viral defense system